MSLRDDPRPLFRRSFEMAASVIDGVAEDQWHLATPCSKFDVEQLTAHLVAGAARPGAVGRGEEISGELVATEARPEGGFGPLFARNATASLDAWSDDALLSKDFVLPWGSYPGSAIVLMYAMEAAVHAWDLAVATGQDAKLDDELAGSLHGPATEMVPAGFRGGEMPFEPVVTIEETARPADQLAAYLGRRRP
ncbi:MAG: TIGR03086 family metal-binding protein [Acidimicrobiales bacterium]